MGSESQLGEQSVKVLNIFQLRSWNGKKFCISLNLERGILKNETEKCHSWVSKTTARQVPSQDRFIWGWSGKSVKIAELIHFICAAILSIIFMAISSSPLYSYKLCLLIAMTHAANINPFQVEKKTLQRCLQWWIYMSTNIHKYHKYIYIIYAYIMIYLYTQLYIAIQYLDRI